jgi:predicted nucleotidyltransferase component of viral defense system
MSKAEPINAHEDADLFREAVRFTAAQTGFVPRLIEKDYFCTLLLDHLATAVGAELVFKGGTCLAKVHSELYRLSEDLDYTIPVATNAPRAERSKRANHVKIALEKLNQAMPRFRVLEPLRGANQSTQYLAVIGYGSVLGRQEEETIRVEVSLREPLMAPAVEGAARTILQNPLTNRSMVMPILVPCIERMEALAEKFRAALSRREPAIRDFFDIDYAARKGGLDSDRTDFVEQVRRKLAIPGNDPPDVSEGRLRALRRQVQAELRPVLREAEFAEFDLDRAFKLVAEMAKAIA